MQPTTRNDRLFWLALAAISFATAFRGLGSPAAVVFDESYGTFWANYFTGNFYIDIHPPHLRLLFAALGWLGGYHGQGFPEFEQPYDGTYFVVQRGFLCALAAMAPLLVARLAILMGASRFWGLLAGWALVFDNLRITESRLVLPDGPLIFCGLAAGVCFGEWLRRRSAGTLFLAAFFLACAISIKWTALAFLVPVLLILGREAISGHFRRSFVAVSVISAVILVWYFAGFAIHLLLLPNTGDGAAFMIPEFNARLAGHPASTDGTRPLGLVAATVELNRTMAAIAGNVGPHPYATAWYTWPLGLRGIYYYVDKNEPDFSRIYLLPNLVLLWTTTLFVAKLLLDQIFQWSRRPLALWNSPLDASYGWMALSFAAFYFPYALIGRPMFLYHYMPSLTFAVAVTAVIATRLGLSRGAGYVWITAVAGFFFFLAPLTYGDSLTPDQFSRRMLLESWN